MRSGLTLTVSASLPLAGTTPEAGDTSIQSKSSFFSMRNAQDRFPPFAVTVIDCGETAPFATLNPEYRARSSTKRSGRTGTEPSSRSSAISQPNSLFSSVERGEHSMSRIACFPQNVLRRQIDVSASIIVTPEPFPQKRLFSR